MAGPMDVKSEVQFVLKDEGITAAVRKVNELETTLKKTKTAAAESSSAMAGLQRGLSSLGTYIAGYLGAAQLVNFLQSSAREFIEAERAANRLRVALKLQGDTMGEQYRIAREYAAALEEVSGVDADLIVSAQAVLVTIGKLTGETLNRATRAALDLSVALGVDLPTAANAIAKAGAGAEAALGKIGIRANDALPPGERFLDLLDQIEKKAGGAAQEIGETLPGAVEKLKTAWGNFKETVGKTLLPPVSEVTDWATALNFLGELIDRTTARARAFARLFSEGFRGAVFGSSDVPTPQSPALPGSKLPGDSGLTYGPSPEDIAAIQAQRDLEEKARAEREKEEAKLEERIAENRLAQFKRTVEEELRENGRALDERAAQQAFFDETNESVFKQLDARKEVEDEILQIVIDSARAELDVRQASLEDWRAFEKNVIDLTVQDARLAAAKKKAIDEDYYRQKAVLAQQAAEAEKMATLDAVTAGTELLGAIFGQNKAFAIAQVIINTAEGVSQAMTLPPPADAIKAAAVIATGAAQIIKIRQTNLGSGGSVGSSYRGGESLARRTSSGAGGGTSGGPPYSQQSGIQGASTSYDNRVNQQIKIENCTIVGGKAGVAELYRMLDQEGRKQRSRLVR